MPFLGTKSSPSRFVSSEPSSTGSTSQKETNTAKATTSESGSRAAGDGDSRISFYAYSRYDTRPDDHEYQDRRRAFAEEVASYPTIFEWQQSRAKPREGHFSPKPLQSFSKSTPKFDVDQFEQFEPENSYNDVDEDQGNSYEERETYDPNSYRPGAPPKESTITDSERQAFDRIFTDIYSRFKDRDHAAQQSKPKHADITAARDAAAALMDKAAKATTSGRTPLTFKQLENVDDLVLVQEKIRTEIEKYPPSLRPSASRALVSVARKDIAQKGDELVGEAKGQLDKLKQLEDLRKPERQRIEGLMTAAKTDLELWQVLEQEVFSMVDKFDLGQAGQPSTGSETSSLEDPGSEAPPKPKVSQLSILGPLYPSHLLLGLRFLSSSFSQPSQLALSILPRIKSLGVISQVLGASTALYNELLRIQWHRHDNYEAVVNLLLEMENSGLEFDEETLKIVRGIRRTRLAVMEGEKGDVWKVLFSQRWPPFARTFTLWERKIKDEVAARSKELERRLGWTQSIYSDSQEEM